MKTPETTKSMSDKKPRRSNGVLAGLLITAPLTAIMYLFLPACRFTICSVRPVRLDDADFARSGSYFWYRSDD